MKLIEGNYTKTPNEILEAIIEGKFNATQLKIMLLIIRYTYGFNRSDHSLSITFLSRASGISRRYLSQEINNLIESGLVEVSKDYTVKSSRRLRITNNIERIKGYGRIAPQVNNTSTDEENINRGIEVDFSKPIEVDFHQETKKQIYKEIPSKEIEDYFNKIWSLYPKQIGKRYIDYKQKEKLYKEVPLEKMIEAIEYYKETIEGTEEKYIKHGSTFFNGDYEEYMNKEPIYIESWRGSDRRL